MDGATGSKSEVRYGNDLQAARESYEAEIAQLRGDLLKARMETSREQGKLRITEQALIDTRRELREAREEICALNDEQPEPAGFNDGLESDVRRGY